MLKVENFRTRRDREIRTIYKFVVAYKRKAGTVSMFEPMFTFMGTDENPLTTEAVENILMEYEKVK